MVITYDDAGRAIKALLALREARPEDKQLLGTFSTRCLVVSAI
jgi:hypothetical protein